MSESLNSDLVVAKTAPTRLPHGLLNGQVAVVTGASRGIGRTICDLFASHGAEVLACVRIQSEELVSWQKMWQEQGSKFTLIQLNLDDDSSQKEAAKQIRSTSRTPTILVNCAGIASGSTFALTSQAGIRQLFETNLFMQLSWSQLMARLLARSSASSIINISSSASQVVDNGTLAYGASKAAFERMSLSMAMELSSQGTRVNVIAPGVTDTDMLSQMDPKARDLLIARQLIKRVSRPIDIANAALFLASDLSSQITGQVIRVDGGLI